MFQDTWNIWFNDKAISEKYNECHLQLRVNNTHGEAVVFNVNKIGKHFNYNDHT